MGNAPMMRDARTEISVKSSGMSVIFNLSKFDSGSHNSKVNVRKLNVCISSGKFSLRAAECCLGWRRQRSSQLFWNHRKHLVVVLDIVAFGSVLVMTDDSYAKEFWCGLLASEAVQKIVSPQATK